jgi:hypothetical protein
LSVTIATTGNMDLQLGAFSTQGAARNPWASPPSRRPPR